MEDISCQKNICGNSFSPLPKSSEIPELTIITLLRNTGIFFHDVVNMSGNLSVTVRTKTYGRHQLLFLEFMFLSKYAQNNPGI